MTLAFSQVTVLQLLAADEVVAVDLRDPARELVIRRAVRGERPPEETVRVLVVVVDPHRRDEQVSELRNRLAGLHPSAAH
jgi:hypothetical protein